MQINFRHAWIDYTFNGKVEKIGRIGSGTRRLYTFFSPLFAFSIVVHLRTVSLNLFTAFLAGSWVRFRLNILNHALLYSTVYGPKIRKLFTLYVKRVSLLSSQPWLVDLNTQHSVTKSWYLITIAAKLRITDSTSKNLSHCPTWGDIYPSQCRNLV